MASHVTRGQLVIQNENFDMLHKKTGVDGKNKSSITATKKGGMGFGSRKALNDITNKSVLRREVSSKKKSSQKEEFNVLEEKFLHDHKKCVEAQHISRNTFLDLVLPGHESVPTTLEYTSCADICLDIPHCYIEPAELSMSEFADILEFSTQRDSPPSSPGRWDLPPSSPLLWQNKAVDFVLKQEN